MTSILVRSPNWIGDQILSYPFFHYLRAAHPRARIGAACVPWVKALQFRDLVDEVVVLPRPEERTLFSRLRSFEEGARAIQASGRWDAGILLPNSFSSAWTFFRAGVGRRRGYDTDVRGLLLHERVREHAKSEKSANPVEHRAQAYVDLLPGDSKPEKPVSEFWGVPPENELDSALPGVIARFDAGRAWPDADPISPPARDYWVLAPGSNAESRRWPLENFAGLARQIARATGWQGLVVGGLAEAGLAESLCENRELGLIDLTGRGSAASLWRIFEGAKFSVCNDSGLAHVAAICGSPVQVVWGAGNPRRTLPMGPKKVQLIFHPADCWPCERNICRQPADRKLQCLRGVTAETVWKEIQDGIRPR